MSPFVVLAVLGGLAICALALAPLFNRPHRFVGFVCTVLVMGCGFGVYLLSSNFKPDQPVTAPTIDEQLQSLQARIEANPENTALKISLARAYAGLKRYEEAASAYKLASESLQHQDPELLLDYAAVLTELDPASIAGEAGQLIENALRLSPGNVRALWFGGSAAAGRGEHELAASRFEQMLRPGMPENVRSIVERNVAALRAQAGVESSPAAVPADAKSIDVAVDIAESMQASFPPQAVFFLTATDKSGGPPLAVVKLPVAAIPGLVPISDSDAMLPGRNLSSSPSIVLRARVSMSGNAIAQPGDLLGELKLDTPFPDSVSLTINQRVE